MSDTDKTRPWRIKVSDHPIEVHNHINGVCDIAVESAGVWMCNTGLSINWLTDCYYEAQWWRPEFRCGCGLCKDWGKSNKSTRRATKQKLKKYLPDE